VNINAMTTTNGTPNNQRMIGMESSFAIDPAGIGHVDNICTSVWFQPRTRIARASELELIAWRRC
jgi:hypothetical protein